MGIAGEYRNIPLWVADWPHCCDFEGDTCDGLRCFWKLKNARKRPISLHHVAGQLSGDGVEWGVGQVEVIMSNQGWTDAGVDPGGQDIPQCVVS